jgi:hypothetical protein
VNKMMTLWVPQETENFLTIQATIDLSRILLLGVGEMELSSLFIVYIY